MADSTLRSKSFTRMDLFNPDTQESAWVDGLDHLDGHVDNGGQNNSWDTCCGSGKDKGRDGKDVMALRNS